MQVVTDVSVGSHTLRLVSRTLTDRPILQGEAVDPVSLRSILLRVPDSEVWVRVDRPRDLEKHIDIWRDARAHSCTTDGYASYKMLRGEVVSTVGCPDVGLHVALKVASRYEHQLNLWELRTSGPKVSNGLRGCREFVYAPAR